MKVYKVNVNGLDYHVQLTEATAKEIGAVLIDNQKKKTAAPAEKPAPTERKKPGPKPKAQTEQKEEKKG